MNYKDTSVQTVGSATAVINKPLPSLKSGYYFNRAFPYGSSLSRRHNSHVQIRTVLMGRTFLIFFFFLSSFSFFLVLLILFSSFIFLIPYQCQTFQLAHCCDTRISAQWNMGRFCLCLFVLFIFLYVFLFVFQV